MARPTGYTDEIAADICERLANGESLKAICDRRGMPNKATVFRWLESHDIFKRMYITARDAQADVLFDEMLKIADTPLQGERTKVDKDGKVIEVTKGDMIEHRRLQIDTRKWMAAKMKPKKYGDKLEIEARVDVGLAARLNEAKAQIARGEERASKHAATRAATIDEEGSEQ